MIFKSFPFLALLGASFVNCACDKQYKNIVDAVGEIVTSVAVCDAMAPNGLDLLDGYGASACNAEQATYAALNKPVILAAAGICYCKITYYGKITDLAGVDAWTTCVGPWNILYVRNSQIANDYLTSHGSQLFSDCSVCGTTAFPTVPPELEQVETVLDFVLDWRKELLNREVDLLRQGIEALVTAALFNGGVTNGAAPPSADFVISAITKGYKPQENRLEQRSPILSSRQSSGNSSDPALQPISELIGVEVKALMVPVNGTLDTLQQQLKNVFSNSTFTDSLAVWNANLTGANYSTAKGDPNNATASTSGSGTASGTTTGTSATASSSGQSGSVSLVVGHVSWTLAIGLLLAILTFT